MKGKLRQMYNRPHRKAILGAAITLIIALLIWWQAGLWYEARLLTDQRTQLRSQLIPYGSGLTTAINQNFAQLEGLAAFAQTYPTEAQLDETFDSFAAGLYAGHEGIRAIQIFPKDGYEYVYPTRSNEAVVGRALNDLINDERPNVRADVQRAIETRQIALSGPYELRQGGLGLVARLPVFQNDDLWAVTVVVLNVPPILTRAGLIPPSDDLQMALRDTNQNVFVGSETTFAADPVVYSVELPDGLWELAAIPTDGWSVAIQEALRSFQVVGLVIVGLITSLAYLIINRQTGLTQAVQERTAALEESQARYQQLFDNNSDALFLLDTEGHILDANQVVSQRYGFERDELLTMTVLDLAASDLREQASSRVKQALTNDFQFQWRHRRKDGSEFSVEINTHPLTLNNQPRILSSVRDITARVEAEEQLRYAKEYAENLIETANVMIVGLDAKGKVTAFNKAAQEVTGYTKHELEGKNWFEVITPKDRYPHVWAEFNRLIEQDLPKTLENPILTKMGQERLIVWQNNRIRQDGDIVGSISFGMDVTERRETEEELHASETRFRALVEQSITGIYVFRENHFLYANRRFCEMFGYSEEEVLTRLLPTDVVAPEDKVTASENVRRRITGEAGSVHYIVRGIRKDGSLLWIEIHGSRMELDGKPAVTGTVLDITKRVEADEVLHNREQQIRQQNEVLLSLMSRGIWFRTDLKNAIAEITESCSDLIQTERVSVWWYNEDHSVIQCFDAYARSTGQHSEGEVLHSAEFPSYYGSHQRGEVIAAVDVYTDPRTREIPAEYYQKYNIRSLLDVPVWLHDRMGGLLSFEHVGEQRIWTQEDERLVSTMATLISLSFEANERRRAEKEVYQLNAELEDRVRQRTAQLEAANKEMEAFAYSVSHDLKAPLRGLDGYSRLLLEDYVDKLDDQGRTFLHSIRRAAKQMNLLIEDLLAYSRLERRTLESGPVNPQVLIESLLSEQADEVQARDITINIDIPCQAITADPEGLAMALRNLLDNALKFTAGVPDPVIEIGGREAENACILWIRDNGVGFDMKFNDRIFDIFQRLHRVEDYAGTGIGLALVRKAMQRMGGSVWAESEPGQGATFYLEMPQ